MLYIGLQVFDNKHVTIAFNPAIEHVEKLMPLLNKQFTVKCTHNGCLEQNGIIMNLGYKVELPKQLQELFTGKVPHITTYVSNLSKPVRTCECVWEDRDPFEIVGTLVAYDNFNRIENF